MKKMFLLTDEQAESLRERQEDIIRAASVAQKERINVQSALTRIIKLAEEMENILADE